MAEVSAPDMVIDTSGESLDDILNAVLKGDSTMPAGLSLSATDGFDQQVHLEQKMLSAEEDAAKNAAGVLYFDIETVPDETRYPKPSTKENEPLGDELLQFIMADKKPSISDFKSFLKTKKPCSADVRKLMDWEQENANRKGAIDEIEKYIARMNADMVAWEKLAVHPLACRIVALGWAIGEGPVNHVIATDVNAEFGLLKIFWELIKGKRSYCGFNTLGFDIPVLLWRSTILNVEPSRQLDRKKYSNREHIDLYVNFFPNGFSTGGFDCKSIAAALGIPVPAEGVDGSMVLPMVEAEAWHTLGEYVESDVIVERAMRYRTGNMFVS